MKKMTVYAIIVTYGDRYGLLEEVVKSLLTQSIAKVIIVDNNSTSSSKIKLQKLERNYNDKISVIYLDTNTGSAAGYKIGIEYALGLKGCQWLWLLDDDNNPDKNALSELMHEWGRLQAEVNGRPICLASFRQNREVYKNAIMRNNPNLVLGRKNTFRAFHLMDLIMGILDRIFPPQFKNINNETGRISAAPYGGMFFNKSMIDLIGYPNEDYYLYVDDHEYSHRVVKKGGEIYLVLNSIIRDIDESWHVKKGGYAFSKIASDDNYLRLYYSVRNRVIFEKSDLISCWPLYILHMFIYTVFVLIVSIAKLRFRNMRVYCTALCHGLKGRLGINEDYTLM